MIQAVPAADPMSRPTASTSSAAPISFRQALPQQEGDARRKSVLHASSIFRLHAVSLSLTK